MLRYTITLLLFKPLYQHEALSTSVAESELNKDAKLGNMFKQHAEKLGSEEE